MSESQTTTSASPVIELSGVDFGYAARRVLKNLNLSVMPGEFLGIVGPNGGGKTTLLHLILGLLRPTRGQIRVMGSEPRSARRSIGYVPQFAAFSSDFPITVRQAVMLGRMNRHNILGGFPREDIRAADQALEQVAGSAWARRPISQLSGGELQRVMLARALVADPEILILDEPTSNVDPHAGRSIFDLLEDVHRHRTILVVSHDVGFISGYVQRVACVNQELVCHETTAMTGDQIAALYGEPVHMIHHAHDHSQGH